MVPWRVNDGNFLVPRIVSDGYRTPFASRGDAASFEYWQVLEYDKGFVLRKNIMDVLRTPRGNAYLVDIGEAQDNGDNIYRQELTYSCVPASRLEPTTINFTQQFYREQTTGDAVTQEVADVTYPVAGYMQFDYSKDTPLPELYKARYLQVFDGVITIGGSPAPAGRIIAEDSRTEIYAGRIYVRMTPYVIVPPTTPVPTT